MYKIALITTIALLGCGCTKTDPSYVTKEQGRKLSDSLTLCIESANKLTDKVNNHEDRLATLETRSGALASGSARVMYLLNSNASPPPLPLTDTRQSADPLISAGHNVIPGAPAAFYGYTQLPPCDLAIKFGEFKNGTELHLANIDHSQTKQDQKLTGHDAAITNLTTKIGELSNMVTGFTNSMNELKQKVENLQPAAPPTPATPATAEEPPKPSS